MRVHLVAGTPAEHAIGAQGDTGRDFALSSYNYATALLEAQARGDAGVAERVRFERFDFPLRRGQRELKESQLEQIVAGGPDVLGLSCYCWSADALLRAAEWSKRRVPGLRVLVGGPSVGFDAPRVLREHAYVDMVAVGEAEESFRELCKRGFEEPWGVAGILARDMGGVIRGRGDRCQTDLAVVRSPYLDGTFAPRAAMLLLEPSRGCRYRCAFCSWSTADAPMRQAPLERIEREIRWAVERGYQGANFCDTAINHSTDALRSLIGAIRRGDPDRALSHSVFLRQERVDEEQARLLGEIRCDEVILGIESVHADVLRRCGKAPLDIAELERRIALLGAHGNRATLSIMSGLPGDSVQGFAQTLDQLEGLMVRRPEAINMICCFWVAILPGTRFAAEAQQYGFRYAREGTPYLVRSNDFAPEDLVECARLLVERVERNPRIRCEEIHRDAARLLTRTPSP